jgi:hypothetical protein
VIRYPGRTDGTQKDGIESAQLIQALSRYHLSGLRVGLAAPIEVLPREMQIESPTDRLQNTETLWNYFATDTVAFNHCDLKMLHSLPSHFAVFHLHLLAVHLPKLLPSFLPEFF